MSNYIQIWREFQPHEYIGMTDAEGDMACEIEKLRDEITRLRARVDALRWPLAVFIHAHASGSNVPPHIEAAARAALEAKP